MFDVAVAVCPYVSADWLFTLKRYSIGSDGQCYFKDHIAELESTLLARMKEVEHLRDNIIKLYETLDIEPR